MITVTPGGHGLGRIPDLGDIRDRRFSVGFPDARALPYAVDLTSLMPPIQNQGQLGSCTAFASLSVWRAMRGRQQQPDLDGSELAQYYWTRILEGTRNWDSGASIRNSIKTMVYNGVAPEDLWPYAIERFTKAPPIKVRRAALKSQVIQYEAVVQHSLSVKTALAAGYPIVFGISVYESFETAQAGEIPMPAYDEKLLGGHAIVLVGYDDATGRFTFRNSWGTEWGNQGYGTLPYAYVLEPNLASDFWIVRLLEG